MCQENVKSQDFSGVFLKNEDSQKCPYICYSKTLLCYYAMRQEEEEDDRVWEILIEQRRAVEQSPESIKMQKIQEVYAEDVNIHKISRIYKDEYEVQELLKNGYLTNLGIFIEVFIL